MIYDLVSDFAEALTAMPEGHSSRPMLSLLDEALRRDVHFLDRHPTTVFQCLWNTCWWYDCPEAGAHYDRPPGGWPSKPPWEGSDPKLHAVLEDWRRDKESRTAGFAWCRSVRPPANQLGTSLKAILREHTGAVHGVAWSSDGRWIASASSDKTARIWDAATGRQIHALHHLTEVVSVAFSPGNETVGTGAGDSAAGEASISKPRRKGLLSRFRRSAATLTPSAETASADSSAAATRRLSVVCGTSDGKVFVWDAETGLQRSVLEGHYRAVQAVAWSSDGRWIATGSDDGHVRIWDAATETLSTLLDPHFREVTGVQFLQDNRQLAISLKDKTIRIWDIESGREVANLRQHRGSTWNPGRSAVVEVDHGHARPVTCVAFSPAARLLASGSEDESVRFWDLETRHEVAVLGHGDHVNAVAFSPDGKCIACGCGRRISADFGWADEQHDDAIWIWDVETRHMISILHGHEQRVTSVTYSPDGRRFASGSADGTIRIWDAKSPNESAVLRGHAHDIQAGMQFSPDGAHLASGSQDGTVRVWNVAKGTESSVLKSWSSINTFDFSPDGKRLVGGSQEFIIWDVRSGKELGKKAYKVAIARLDQGFDDRVKGAATVADLDKAENETSVSVNVVRYAHDGKTFVVAGDDAIAWIYDARTGKRVTALLGHKDSITSLAYSPDCRLLATGSRDTTARIWDLSSGKELLQLRQLPGPKKLQSWMSREDLESIKNKDSLEYDRILEADQEKEREHAALQTIFSIQFSPDGSRLLTVSNEEVARISKRQNGRLIATINGVSGAAMFSPDGRCVVGRSSDGNTCLWDAATGECLETHTSVGDLSAIAIGPPQFPYWLFRRGLESELIDAATHQPIAWFPSALEQAKTHSNGHTWAGVLGRDVVLVNLEGAQNTRGISPPLNAK